MCLRSPAESGGEPGPAGGSPIRSSARVSEAVLRPAADPDQAARELRAEASAGRLDGEAVDAVLRAAGHRAPARRAWPGGLTQREVEVLTLLARGNSSRLIAQQLVVSPKTAANHVEHIYAKLGVSSRAAATLYATQHGLLGAFESV